MQLIKAFVAITSLAVFATANPVPEPEPMPNMKLTKRDHSSVQQACGNNLKVQCCNNFQTMKFGWMNLPIGNACNDIAAGAVDVSQTCTQKVACCQTGSQTGLVNIGNICPILIM